MNSDNKFWKNKCPAQMSSGRLFTNYMSATRLNEYVEDLNKITNHHRYSEFLQTNAEKIMKNEIDFNNNNKRCDFGPKKE